jgi:hypothetical protein
MSVIKQKIKCNMERRYCRTFLAFPRFLKHAFVMKIHRVASRKSDEAIYDLGLTRSVIWFSKNGIAVGGPLCLSSE